MRAASLHKAELYRTGLAAELSFAHISESRAYAAELCVTEAVASEVVACEDFGDELAACVGNTFGNSYHALAAVLLHYRFNVVLELVDGERNFGEIDEVCAETLVISKACRSSQPACMSAHDLNYGDHRGVVNVSVQLKLHHRGSDVLSRAAVTGAMIGAEQVVVDGLGYADDSAFPARLLHELAYLVAGIHRVVTAVVEEVTDIVFLEYFEKSLVIGIVNLFGLELISYRTESGRRGVFKEHELFHVLFADIVEFLVEYASDTVRRTVYLSDAILLERFDENASRRRVDNRRGAAGLTEHTSADQFFHNILSSENCIVFCIHAAPCGFYLFEFTYPCRLSHILRILVRL